MKKYEKKGEVVNLDIYQFYMAFVQEVISRSVQYYKNEAEFFDDVDILVSQFKSYNEFSNYLDDLLVYLLTWSNFKEWSENRHEA